MNKTNIKLLLLFFYSFGASPRSDAGSEMDIYHEAVQTEEYEKGFDLQDSDILDSIQGASSSTDAIPFNLGNPTSTAGSSTDRPIHLEKEPVHIDEYLSMNIDALFSSDIDQERIDGIKEILSTASQKDKYILIDQMLTQYEKEFLVDFLFTINAESIHGAEELLSILTSRVALPNKPKAIEKTPNTRIRIAEIQKRIALDGINLKNIEIKDINPIQMASIKASNASIYKFFFRNEIARIIKGKIKIRAEIKEMLLSAIEANIEQEEFRSQSKLSEEILKIVNSMGNTRKEIYVVGLMSNNSLNGGLTKKLTKSIDKYFVPKTSTITPFELSDLFIDESQIYLGQTIRANRGRSINATIQNIKQQNPENQRLAEIIIDYFYNAGIIKIQKNRFFPNIELPDELPISKEEKDEIKIRLESKINDEIIKYIDLLSKEVRLRNLDNLAKEARIIIKERRFQ